MKTLSEVDKLFYEKLGKLREQYREALQELLKENSLDKGVIRIEDGKEGVLAIDPDLYTSLRYGLKFYPITRNGEVSKKSSGGCIYLQEFKPKEG